MINNRLKNISKIFRRQFSSKTTQLKIKGKNATIEIGNDSTHDHNLLTSKLLSDLKEDLTELNDSNSIQNLLIWTEKPHFSAGAQMKELLNLSKNKGKIEEYFKLLFEVKSQIQFSHLKTYVIFNGFCIGGGLGAFLDANHPIATDDAVLALSGASVGLGTFDSGIFNRFDGGKTIDNFTEMLNFTSLPLTGIELENILIDFVIKNESKKVKKNLSFFL